MRRLRCALLVLLFFVVWATSAYAQSDISSSGNGFLATCSVVDKPQDRWSEVDFLHSGQCLGFMQGLEEGIGLAFSVVKKGEGSVEDLGVCFPSDGTVTTGQITSIVLKYLKENPEKAHERTATLVVLAAKTAFPCAAEATRKP